MESIQTSSQGRSVAETKNMAAGDQRTKKRPKASRNEYSKKSLGEISTAAYNTSLENTKYRNRYCN